MKAHHLFITDNIGEYVDQFGNKRGITAQYVRDEISKAKSNGAEKLVLHMATFGGSVFVGFEIFNAIEATNLPVDVYVESMCGSIGTLIMLAGGEKNTIYMTPTSQLLFHKPSGSTEGNADAHLESVNLLNQISELMAQRYAAKMGKDVSEGHSLMAKGDYTLMPSDALSIGVVDHIQKSIAAFGKEKVHNKKENMKSNNKNLLQKLTALLMSVDNAITAGVVKLADGTTSLYFDGDLETGKEIFTDEEMTVHASEGEHAIEDGRFVIVDAAGVIVEIREIEAGGEDQSEALATANARIAELEGELATANASIANIEASHKTALTGIKAQITQLKAQVISDGKTAGGEHGGEATKESAFIQKTRERVALAKAGKLMV